MGIAVFLIGQFCAESWEGVSVAEIHEAFRAAGFESAPGDGAETVEYKLKPADGTYFDGDSGRTEVSTFTDRLWEHDQGKIPYHYDSDIVEAIFRSDPTDGDLPMPVGVGGPNREWFDPESVGEETATQRADALAEVFVNLSTAIDPDVAYLCSFNDHSNAEAVPKSHNPDEHGLEALPFLLLLGEDWIEHCGGREHVLETPAYGVQTLDTGSIALRVTERPARGGCRNQGEVYRHLLDS